MRIAQVSTLSSPVREDAGGSVEAWVWLLTRELIRLGHEVTVFGAAAGGAVDGFSYQGGPPEGGTPNLSRSGLCAGSQTTGEFVPTLPGPYGAEESLDDWHL